MSHDLARKRALRALARRVGASRTVAALALLDEALTHDSYAHERTARAQRAASNERLEFLGDAVIGTIVARTLYDRHASESEGLLSRRRAALVSRDALAKTALRLGVAPLILLGKGEAAAGGERRPSILAGVFEAIVGAISLSDGFDAAAAFVSREHLAHAEEVSQADPKTTLQEYAQARFKRPPSYAVIRESGPAHAKTYTVAVSIGGAVMGTGAGTTKKEAQSAAAAQALRGLQAARPRRGHEPSI
jgi:ribonuclease III